jgi:hypothetical protein
MRHIWKGGHHAAWERLDVFATELRTAFRSLPTAEAEGHGAR